MYWPWEIAWKSMPQSPAAMGGIKNTPKRRERDSLFNGAKEEMGPDHLLRVSGVCAFLGGKDVLGLYISFTGIEV